MNITIFLREMTRFKDGFSRQNITHMIMLRKDGTAAIYKRGAGK